MFFVPMNSFVLLFVCKARKLLECERYGEYSGFAGLTVSGWEVCCKHSTHVLFLLNFQCALETCWQTGSTA